MNVFDREALEAEMNRLRGLMNDPNFWDNVQSATEISKQLNSIESSLAHQDKLLADYEELEAYLSLLEAESDAELAKEFLKAYNSLAERVRADEITGLLGGEYDGHNAIVHIHPGAGGIDSQDWAESLLRLYLRWAEQHDYKVEMWNYHSDPEAGIKEATFLVSGPYAYGYLKAENGIHRLVRISPFDTSGRRHTSFASVDVLPEISLDDKLVPEIRSEDLRIDTYRAGGAGGQHVNKTESAVRITHLPTGIVVQCQSERSQHLNRNTAMRMLASELAERERRAHEEQMAKMRGDGGDIAWGNQIRSYVFHPYSLVKDHRTDEETGNIAAVMDGDIDRFIEAYLRQQRRGG